MRRDNGYEMESWGETLSAVFKRVLITFAVLIVLTIAGWFVYHAWWTDTYCTMIAGTQVCR
jgi:hypothetical protein